MSLSPTTSPLASLLAYEVLGPLGEGAMATVTKVRARADGSIRALKLLKPEDEVGATAAARFADEFRILRRLTHPSLPQVFDYGVAENGSPYMVMELLEGEPLDTYFAGHKDDLWMLIYQLTETLSFVHDHSLLHLDLKPDNVVVRRTRAFGESEQPLAMLIDFGLSYRRGDAFKKMVGTPDYMSPETITGKKELTRAADYYSLGIIIYELVEGRVPFTGNLNEVLRAHLTQPVTFSQQKVDYAELYPWIERLLAKEPKARLEAFQDFRRTLAARLGEKVDDVNRAYALGYIDSFGLFGKKEAWETLDGWVTGIRDLVSAAVVEQTIEPKTKTTTTPDITTGDIDKMIEEDILSGRATDIADPSAALSRVLSLSGPPESGKTHLLQVLDGHARLHGVHTVRLGAGGDYAALAGSGGNRLVRAWEYVHEQSKSGGVILLIDDVDRVAGEELEFLEYVDKRIEMLETEGTSPNIFIVASGDATTLVQMVPALVARQSQPVVLNIPPPSTDDVDAVVEEFHGHMSGRDERQALAQFLGSSLQSMGAMFASLRESVRSGGLSLSSGSWQFHERLATKAKTSTSSADYYKNLLSALPTGERELLRWLSCHRGALGLQELSELSGLSVSENRASILGLRPHRLLIVSREGESERLRFVNDDLRRAFHDMVDDAERQKIHQAYVAHYSEQPLASMAAFEELGFHHEQLGHIRETLLLRVKALRAAKAANDVFAIRRLCEEGIAFVDGITDPSWKDRREPLRTYFIKNCLNIEWSITNYARLIKLVDECVLSGKRPLPVQFAYKFATALERAGDIDRCKDVIAESKKRVSSKTSETYHLLLLAEASVSFITRDYTGSLEALGAVDMSRVNTSAQTRVHVLYMLDYGHLGKQKEHQESKQKAREMAERHGHYDHLLRVNFSEIMSLLMAAKYEDAKKVIGESVRLGTQHNVQRSLCTIYLAASSVYGEAGQNDRAIDSLEKATRIAVDNGLDDLLAGIWTETAIVYQNLGRYGTAIQHGQAAVDRLSRLNQTSRLFNPLLILFELYTTVNSDDVSEYVTKLEILLSDRQAEFEKGLYWRLLGNLHFDRASYEEALKHYETARDIYLSVNYDDDAARMGIMVARTLLSLERLDDASQLIDHLKAEVAPLESKDIAAEYLALRMTVALVQGVSEESLKNHFETCRQSFTQVRAIPTLMSVEASLIRTAISFGDFESAINHFGSYYSRVKKISANLPANYVNGFVQNREFQDLLSQIRALQRKDPSQPS